MKYIIQCPRCKAQRGYQPISKYIKGKTAKCFRCEKYFVVWKSPTQNQIIRVIKQLQ